MPEMLVRFRQVSQGGERKKLTVQLYRAGFRMVLDAASRHREYLPVDTFLFAGCRGFQRALKSFVPGGHGSFEKFARRRIEASMSWAFLMEMRADIERVTGARVLPIFRRRNSFAVCGYDLVSPEDEEGHAVTLYYLADDPERDRSRYPETVRRVLRGVPPEVLPSCVIGAKVRGGNRRIMLEEMRDFANLPALGWKLAPLPESGEERLRRMDWEEMKEMEGSCE